MKTEKENTFENKLALREVVPYLNLPSHKNNNVNLWNFKKKESRSNISSWNIVHSMP